ncbi:MAG TPA: branched-chain amino acid ABC transporter permease [Stellaceae bacterium]|nr:branched-chain amino acid ABC transporter permease [Stellaceae bacterium]
MRRAGETRALIAAGILLAGLPLLVSSERWLGFSFLALLYALLGQSWNVLGGFGGQYSFGHAAFFGTGGYATAVLQARWGLDPWSGAALGVIMGALAGAGIGAVSFRYGLRGSYFALVTLAFAEVFRVVANSVAFTGGGVGILIPLRTDATNFQFADRRAFYYVALAFLAIAVAAAEWLTRSRFGARLVALRENEAAAQALGIDVFRVKLGAITLSAALAALAGVLYAQYFLYLDPAIAYGPAMSIAALLSPIVGGLGTVLGPLWGAVALRALGEATTELSGDAPGLNLVLYGILLVVMLRFLPEGIAGLPRRLHQALSAERHHA